MTVRPTGRRVVLHVGAPKSGTTHVQSRMQRNRATLLEHGVLVPQATDEEGPATLVFRAALDLTGIRLGRGRAYADGRWDRLVAAVRAHDGVAWLSDEAFSRADDAAVARAVRDLTAGGARLDVVLTARDLGRSLVSSWLEGLKHGGSESFGAFLERARSGGLGSLRTLEVDVVLGRWLHALGDPARVHLVTVPPEGGDRSLLWARFLAASGVDGAWTPAEAARSNDAVGLPEAQFLRALNAGLDGAARRGGPLHAQVQEVVVPALAAGARAGERVRLDPHHEDWVVERTERWRRWVTASGVPVVGDLADLDVDRLDPGSWVDPDAPTAASLAAADAALAAVRRAREERSAEKSVDGSGGQVRGWRA